MQAGAAVQNAATNRAGLGIRQQQADTASRRADAYTGYMGRLGRPKPMSAASQGITRRIVQEEIRA